MASNGRNWRVRFAIIMSGWIVVLKRTRANWPILSANFLTMLLATSLLAAAPIYSRTVAGAGLRQELRDAPVTGANVEVSLSVPGSRFTQADNQVRQALGPIIDLTHGSGTRAGFSSSFGLPDADTSSAAKPLAVFGFFDRLAEHATLLAGNWPATSASGPVQVAVPEPVATGLKLAVGDQLKLTNRVNPDTVVPVQISGIYKVTDPNDPFWFDDDLSQNGVVSGGSFITYGPFVVAPSDFLGAISQTPATIDWRVFPDFNQMSAGQSGQLEHLVNSLPGRVTPVLSGTTPRITTGLGDILATTARSLLVTRTAVLLLAIQLAILSMYALVLTAGLLSERRHIESTLLETRGASHGQLAMMALLEGVLLAVPALIAGPWVAAFSLRVLNVIGPLSGIGLRLDPSVDRTAYLLAILGAALCVLAMVRPALFPPKPMQERSATRSLLQRARLDLGLVVVAGIGIWQLKHYGSPLTETVQGSYGIDPLLVAAPALGLLAGAVITLRLIPLLARSADRLAARRAATIISLGAWQIARRPLRYARTALLLTLAVGIGLFAVAYSRTWSQSQADQAAYQVGAGIRLTPDQRTGAIPDVDLTNAHRTVPGVTASMPVGHQYVSLPDGSSVAQLLLLDTSAAPGIVAFRSDLSGTPFTTLMGRLGAERPDLSGVPIADSTTRLRLDYSLSYAESPSNVPPTVGPTGNAPPPPGPEAVGTRLTAIIEDGSGILRSFDLGVLANDGQPHQLVLQLADQLSGDNLARPTGPLQLIQLQLNVYSPGELSFDGEFHLTQLAQSDQMSGDQWTPVPLVGTKGDFVAGPQPANGVVPPGAPHIDLTAAQDGQLGATIVTGADSTPDPSVPIEFTLTPSGSDLPQAIPVLVDGAFLRQLGIQLGGTFPLQSGAGTLNAQVVGTVTNFPTVDPSQPVIIADYGTFDAMALLQRRINPTDANERWLAVDPAQASAATSALKSAPFSSPTIVSLVDRRQALQADPVALGTIGALSLGFIAALVFAVVGFAVSAATSIHERVGEFTTLRAIGLSPRQLAGWLMLEQGVLVVLGLLGGTIVGLGLSWLVLPLITVTQAGTPVVPSLLVVLPWLRLIEMEATIIGLLTLIVGVAAMLLRRVGIGQILRMGVE